jgi:predicted dehydrogenase
MPTVKRAALLGVAHWHVPLMLRGFALAGLEVAAAWDPDVARARDVAGEHGASAFADAASLLDAGGLDCVLVSGPPSAMPALARAAIARRLPLSLEKPCALTSQEVAALHEEAQAAAVTVAVPLVQRHAALGRALIEISRDDPPLEFAVRFVAGPPARYERSGNAWMLDPRHGGGGAAVNLAVHFVDLATLVTGSPVADVVATMSDAQHGRAVEDLAVLALRHANGAVSQVTAGYRFPESAPFREFRLTMSGRRTYVETDAEGLVVREAGRRAKRVPVPFDTDGYYAEYVRSFADDVRNGRAPVAGLAEMARALAVVEAGYRSAAEGRRVAVASVA